MLRNVASRSGLALLTRMAERMPLPGRIWPAAISQTTKEWRRSLRIRPLARRLLELALQFTVLVPRSTYGVATEPFQGSTGVCLPGDRCPCGQTTRGSPGLASRATGPDVSCAVHRALPPDAFPRPPQAPPDAIPILSDGPLVGGSDSLGTPCGTSTKCCQFRFRQTALADRPLTHPASSWRIPFAEDVEPVTHSVCFHAGSPLGQSAYSPCHLDADPLQNPSISRSQSRFGQVSLAGHPLCRRPLPWRLPYGSLSQSATVSLSCHSPLRMNRPIAGPSP
jgi:hypothetical protein